MIYNWRWQYNLIYPFDYERIKILRYYGRCLIFYGNIFYKNGNIMIEVST